MEELTMRGSKMADPIKYVYTTLRLGVRYERRDIHLSCSHRFDIEHMSLASVWREFI